MFGRIQTVDNKVLYNISRMHKPALTKIMVASSRLGNAGFVWWAICIPFFVVPEWRKTGFNFVFALCLAHLMGEIIIKHLVKRTRPCGRGADYKQTEVLLVPVRSHYGIICICHNGAVKMSACGLPANSYACILNWLFKNLSESSLSYRCSLRYVTRLNLRCYLGNSFQQHFCLTNKKSALFELILKECFLFCYFNFKSAFLTLINI